MAKYKLDIENDYSFETIGICANVSDYRLCWSINKALSIQLVKEEDYCLENKKGEKDFFSFYSYYDEADHVEFYLFRNLSDRQRHLIPEKDQIDYFIVIRNNYIFDLNEILMKIKEIDSILTAFIFDVNALKSKENLIF